MMPCFFGSPKGNRTPDSALRGRRLNRLTMGPNVKCLFILTKIMQKINKILNNHFFLFFCIPQSIKKYGGKDLFLFVNYLKILNDFACFSADKVLN